MRNNLALAFQEPLTTIAKVFTENSELRNMDAFRARLKSALAKSEKKARQWTYSERDVELAKRVVVAWADEGIINSGLPVFERWAGHPLQVELFSTYELGDSIFEDLESLEARPDSHQLADLLEVYCLCLQMGFRGKHRVDVKINRAPEIEPLETRIFTIRDRPHELSPSAMPLATELAPVPVVDPWIRWWLAGFAVCCLFCVGLYIVLAYSLDVDLRELRSLF